jgi:hypothetical protein
MKRAVLILFSLLCAGPAAFAGSRVQTQADASLEVQFDGKEPDLSLADLITVTLTVHGARGVIVTAPLELPTSAPWSQVERKQPTRKSVDGRDRWQIVYRFAPREPGKLTLDFPDVKFQNPGASEQTVSWAPITFSVTTTATEMRDITSIEELPPITPADHRWLLWLSLALIGFLAIAGLVVIRRLSRRVRVQTAAERALHEWERLLSLKLPETGRSERFITLLTVLLRRYLERQYAMPARRQTTAEFRRSLDGIESLTAEEKQFLATFLERCEAIKFAGMTMSVDECARWARETRSFLERAGRPA